MFKAGFSRVDVTPPLGTELTGYFTVRISDGILDPIYLNALALSDGENTALIITGDFMYTIEKAMHRFRSLIAEKTGLPMDCIFIQSLHQHTSTSAGIGGPTDLQYQGILERKFCDVAQMALDDLKEAAPSIAAQETPKPISFIRRFRMKDGSTKTNPGRSCSDIDHPLGTADNTVRLVKFEREGAKDIALVGFQTHPDVIAGNKFSADWPGFVRRMTEAALPDVHCILINGCEGDTNHIDITLPAERNKGYEYSRYMGRTIADVAIGLWDKTTAVAPSKLTAKVEMKRIPSNTNGLDRLDECIKTYKEFQESNTNAFAGGKSNKKFTMAEIGEMRRISCMEEVTLVQKVPVSIIAFGKIALIGYGGEPFTEYADILRREVPELFILTACLANGAEGYLPSTEAFEEGGYEARTTNFTPSVAPVLQTAAIEMLKEHRKSL